MRSIWIIRNESEAKLLVDPMRREILRLLAGKAHTENALSTALGLTPPAVGHHLQPMREAGFIRIDKIEIESHGIVQKFYRANALAFIIDHSKLPLEMERYFAPVERERARGLIGGLLLNHNGFDRSIGFMDRLCEDFSRVVVEVAEEYNDGVDGEDPEVMITNLYREAIGRLVRKDTQIYRGVSQTLAGLCNHPRTVVVRGNGPSRR